MNIYKSICVAIFTSLNFFGYPAFAQIKPDNTLDPETSKVNSISELRARIEGGAIRGENLFHSFKEFSIGEGLEAYFANPDGIKNIFSRVTGDSRAEIFGTLGVEGSANLFLINPHGIVFGENAVIDVMGSFMATTAESIKFNSGDEFSAVEPKKPVLTLNFPVGYNFGSNPADIVAEGLKNGVLIEIPGFNSVTDNKPSGLTAASGETISLVGGNITFRGGGVTVEGGRIELGSVGKNQTVTLSQTKKGNWMTSYENVTEFQDISLLEAAYLDSTGDEAGAIALNGRNITLDNSSVILANTIKSSSNSTNSVWINASQLLKLQGNININSNSVSFISADVLPNAVGDGIDININATKLQLFDGAEIRAVNFSASSNSITGEINIDAKQIEVTGIKLGEVPVTSDVGLAEGGLASLITNTTGIDSNGGNANKIEINTDVLKVLNGGRIKADTFSMGEAGNLIIDAKNIELRGLNPLDPNKFTTLSSSIAIEKPSNQINDNKGNIYITTNNLQVADGAQISASGGASKSTAGAGNININANNIELNGYGRDKASGVVSGIFASVGAKATGNGGNINIDTNTLKIGDGARIQSDSGGLGQSGNVNINAQNVELNGTRERIGQFVSGITTSTGRNSQNNGGNVRIESEGLTVKNGSQINALALGEGGGGNITLDVERVEFNGQDQFGFERSSGLFTNSASGNGGNIIIQSERLQLLNQSQISASAGGEGNGGNITIDSGTVLGVNNSDIMANAVFGNGGNIEITTNRILGLEKRDKLTPQGDVTATSEFGLDGSVKIDVLQKEVRDELLVVRTEFPPSTRDLIKGTCLDSNRSRGGKLVYLGRGGIPESPYNYFDDEEIVALKRSEETDEEKKEPDVWLEGAPRIDANAVIVTRDGRTYLVAETKMPPEPVQVCTRDTEDVNERREQDER